MQISIAIAQMNAQSADLQGNGDKILHTLQQAERLSADLLILPEACLCGYPIGDIASRPQFLKHNKQAITRIINATKNTHCAVLFGSLGEVPNPEPSPCMPHNSLYLADRGKLIATINKHLLPNDDVFYEKRLFAPASLPEPVEFRGIKLGIMICNDMWYQEPSTHLRQNNAEILIVANASPWYAEDETHIGKHQQRLTEAHARVQETGLPLVFVHGTGGQDELLFDGQSFIINGNGEIAMQAPAFSEELLITQWQKNTIWQCTKAPISKPRERLSLLYQGITVSLRDYLHKSGFNQVLLGLSGGIDSALCAILAVDALGPENVLGVAMPTTYTSQASLDDAAQLAKNLGIAYDVISIEEMRKLCLQNLKSYTDSSGIASENIQARLRGNILMFIANAQNKMLLSTGNKSESAMGYATLYGDTCGGFAPIKDVYKTDVFKLAKWRNNHYENYMKANNKPNPIPENIITKAPSAELRHNQKDEDSLPPYDKLDPMLKFLIEQPSLEPSASFTKQELNATWQAISQNEYKRAQCPIGPKLTSKAFGSGWYYPIAHKYRNEYTEDE